MEYSIFKDRTNLDHTATSPLGKRPFARMASPVEFHSMNDDLEVTASVPQIVDTRGGATRKRVGKAGMNEFTLPAKRESRSKTPEIDYAPARTKNKVRKSKGSITSMPFWKKALWGTYALMVVRLIFMQGGLLDFYYMEQALQDKKEEIAMLIQENEKIAYDIDRVKNDRNFQKQLTRENLGVIADDEYLVVFAREAEGKSI